MTFPFLFLISFVLFDSGFVKVLLDGNESAWQRLNDETIPPEQDLETFAELANKLARFVPRRSLKENVSGSLSPQHGEVVRLGGRISSVTKYDAVYRCEMELDSGRAVEVFVPFIPQAWEHHSPQQERAAAFAVYVKSYKNIMVFAAPAIEWYPDTWLGNLGFDVASFDQVPVSRITELEHHDEETNRRMFKFTESDAQPFYGLLRAVSATPEGWLEEEAKKQQAAEPISVTDLFNRPNETRGKPVLLRGTVKRIVPTPVTDSEVQSLFGIDHYYQVYLFVNESRGNPIVVCVRSLPAGMPTGDGGDFSEAVTAAAVPYKLWIYETAEEPHYAPLLIGRSLTWHPSPSERQKVPAGFATFSFAVFFTLAILWFACRFWARHLIPRPSGRCGLRDSDGKS